MQEDAFSKAERYRRAANRYGEMAKEAEPGYLATYSTVTQEWVKTSFKTASVAPPDCKLGKT